MALRSALRSGPQVLLVGEMRDAESITAAVEFVRTGHLLYSTMHVDGVAAIPTEIAARTGNDASMLARVTGVLSAAVYQRLAKRADGAGRVAVREYLIMTHALRRTLLPLSAADAETCLADAMKRAGTDLESEATRLVDQGVITADEALRVTGGLL
jgi:Tfp pilus assembly pilus retraction ATPase PilT